MVMDKIEAALHEAMTGGADYKAFERQVLRTIKGTVQQHEKNTPKGKEFGESDVVAVLSSAVAQRRESAKEYQTLGQTARAEHEAREADYIATFLPAQLSEDEVAQVVTATIAELGAQGPKDRGRVIGAVRSQVGAAGDPKVISKLVVAAL